jgi:hypothetical protein
MITAAHLLLLRFLFFADDQSTWSAWSKANNLNDVDANTFELLPLLSRRLERLALSSPDAARLAGVYKQAWVKNQLMVRRLQQVAAQLHSTGIDFTLLGDAALSLEFYSDIGVRAIRYFTFLVAQHDVWRTVTQLEQCGFKLREGILEHRLPYIAGAHLIDKSGQLINLRWHAFSQDMRAETTSAFTHMRQPLPLGDTPTATLNPTAQLLWVLCDDSTFLSDSIWWIADALQIMIHHKVDWQWIGERVKMRAVAHRFYTRFGMLASQFPIPLQGVSLSDHVLPPASLPSGRAMQAFSNHWSRYVRTVDAEHVLQNVFGFVEYLRVWWNLEHWWQVPLYALKRKSVD